MNIRRISIAAPLLVVALNVWAGGGGAPANANATVDYDVTGTWTAKIETGRTPAQTMVFVLKQDGKKVTGTVSTNDGPPVEISGGTAGRSALRFSVVTTVPVAPMPGLYQPNRKTVRMVTKYTARISGDDMELERQMRAQMPELMTVQTPGGAAGGGRTPGGIPLDSGGMAMAGGTEGGPAGMNATIKAYRE